MTLDVCIIGAGIAGLSAAVALRQAGQRVTVVEKSRFAAEVGAALAVAPNGARVLAALGFSFDRARAVDLTAWETVDGTSLEQLDNVDLRPAAKAYGHPMRAVYRVDLHKELLRLAFDDGDGGDGGDGGRDAGPGTHPVTLKLAAPVKSVDAVQGKVVLEDGTVYTADLIIGADGLHSVARREVMGGEIDLPKPVVNAFRFLVPTEKMNADDSLKWLREWKTHGSSIFVDTKYPGVHRHAVWYRCRGGEIQNLVGICPPRPGLEDGKGKVMAISRGIEQRSLFEADTDYQAMLLDEFSHFSPELLKLFRLGENVKCWPLSHYEPFPSWHSGKVVLIGDAAHPMLPFGGQAANQALEDVGALGFLFKGVESADDIPEALRLFEKIRRKRGSMIQVLSSTMVNHEVEAHDKLAPFVEDGFISKGDSRCTTVARVLSLTQVISSLEFCREEYTCEQRCRQVCQQEGTSTKA